MDSKSISFFLFRAGRPSHRTFPHGNDYDMVANFKIKGGNKHGMPGGTIKLVFYATEKMPKDELLTL